MNPSRASIRESLMDYRTQAPTRWRKPTDRAWRFAVTMTASDLFVAMLPHHYQRPEGQPGQCGVCGAPAFGKIGAARGKDLVEVCASEDCWSVVQATGVWLRCLDIVRAECLALGGPDLRIPEQADV